MDIRTFYMAVAGVLLEARPADILQPETEFGRDSHLLHTPKYYLKINFDLPYEPCYIIHMHKFLSILAEDDRETHCVGFLDYHIPDFHIKFWTLIRTDLERYNETH